MEVEEGEATAEERPRSRWLSLSTCFTCCNCLLQGQLLTANFIHAAVLRQHWQMQKRLCNTAHSTSKIWYVSGSQAVINPAGLLHYACVLRYQPCV